LAKKSRTPPPPRRPVQAPQRRAPEGPDRRRLFVLLGLGAVVLAAAIAGFLIFGGDESEASAADAMRDAGCELRSYPALPAGVHINDLNARPDEWNSFPPTSGVHHSQWVIWGAYDEPVSVAQSVHNLEHGGIVIFYGDEVPASTVEQLNLFYRDDPNGMLLAPLPELNDEITLTAWVAPPEGDEQHRGMLARCTTYDEEAFKAFRDEFRFKGPEAFPPEALAPGS
jgi:Protein of unknown function (DUF3105)